MTARTGSWDRLTGQENRGRTGKPGQDSQDRTSGSGETGHLIQDNLIGQPGKDIGLRKPRQDNRGRQPGWKSRRQDRQLGQAILDRSA
jgi:hypothetical protein